MSVQRWIHCGLCNNLMANKETKFYHLSCTDVLCRSCMGQTNRGTSCPLCNATIRHFTELGDSMSRREKILYHSAPISFYQIASQTLTFQQKHRKNLVQAILKARDSLRRLDELETQIRQQIVETQKRYENMRRFRRSLQESMRKTVTSSDRRNVDADALCPVATGIISQRRISTSTPFFRPSVTPVQSQRRFSVDSYNLINSVKMSQANYSNDSGIGITPSSDCSIGSSNRSTSTSTPKTISPIRPNAISHRRVSVGIGALPKNFTPFKAPRRYSTDSFNELISGQSSDGGNGMSNVGGSLANSLFIGRSNAATTVSDFYSNNKK